MLSEKKNRYYPTKVEEGQRYGDYEVVRRAPDLVTPLGQHRQRWYVACTREGCQTLGYSVEAGHRLYGGKVTMCLGCRRRNTQIQRLRESPGMQAAYSAWGRLRRSGEPMRVLWQDSFDVFLKDVGPSPEPYAALTRLDPSKPWGPGNAVWLPNLARVARELGISKQALDSRIRAAAGDPLRIAEALSKPKQPLGRHKVAEPAEPTAHQYLAACIAAGQRVTP